LWCSIFQGILKDACVILKGEVHKSGLNHMDVLKMLISNGLKKKLYATFKKIFRNYVVYCIFYKIKYLESIV